MHHDPVQVVVLILLVILAYQVLRRAYYWLTNFLLAIVILAVLLPEQTRGLLHGLMAIFTEIVNRLLYTLGGLF